MRQARFEEGKSVDVPQYLRDSGNSEAADQWEKMSELHKDKFKKARLIARVAKFEEGKSVDVPEYLRSKGNPEAAKDWEDNTEKYGDKFKMARAVAAKFEEGKSVDVPEYLRDAGNEQAAKEWEEMNKIHGDNFKKAGFLNKTAGEAFMAREGLDAETVRSGNGAMLYRLDPAQGFSHFYEMKIVQQGSRWLLKRLWGDLRDAAGSEHVTAKDEVFHSAEGAQAALKAIWAGKEQQGFVDAFGPKHEDPFGVKLPMGQYPEGLDRTIGFGGKTLPEVTLEPQLKGVRTQVQQAYEQVQRGDSLELISQSLQSAERILKSMEQGNLGGMSSKLLEKLTPISRMVQEFDIQPISGVQLAMSLSRFLAELGEYFPSAHF